MKYALSQIKKDVRIALEENREVEQLLVEAHEYNLTLEELVEASILKGIRMVETEARVEFLEGGHPLEGDIHWLTGEYNGGGRIVLPEDFMRMIVFKMSDWYIPVYSFIGADSPGYLLQRSKWKGIKGTPEKPVCAIVPHPDGLSLEFYSSYTEGAEPEQCTYLPMPEFDEDDNVEICRRCYHAVVYKVAALVLNSYEKADLAKIFDDIATNLLV